LQPTPIGNNLTGQFSCFAIFHFGTAVNIKLSRYLLRSYQ
jgi:hypothetical protein